MRICAAQMNVKSGEVSVNTAEMVCYIERAAANGADTVIFPEMTDTGYDMNVILKTASSWDLGPVPALSEAAARNQVNIIAGVSERKEGVVFNAVVVIAKNGSIIGSYRKTHLITAEPMLEHHFLEPGDRLGLIQIGSTKIGIMTCYEIRFPEIARALAILGAHIIVVPAAWPLVRLPHWQALISARAIENQLFVVGVGRIGNDNGMPFAGTSMIVGPYGNILASGTQIHESLVEANLDMNEIEIVRSQIQVYQDRKPHLYSAALK